MSLANFIDPDTLVRSPIFTKFVSGVIVRTSRPLSLVYFLISGLILGLYCFDASAIFRMCCGVVPQQPPIIFTHPSFIKSSAINAMNDADWSYSPNWFGRPAFGWADT